MTKVAQLPFSADVSAELCANFRAILEELGLDEMVKHVEGATNISMLSKLGAALECITKKFDDASASLSRLQVRMTAWQATNKKHTARAKQRALQRLDPEETQKSHAKVIKRRRFNFANVKTGNPSTSFKKRIQDDFTDMPPSKRYRPQVSLQERFEVVQWYKTMTSSTALVVYSDDEDECEGQDEDSEARKKAKRVRRNRKARERRARKKKTWKTKGVNLLELAMKKFPASVGPNTSLGRWAKAAERQRWADLPEQVRRDHKEIPDSWKRAVQSEGGIKGQRRFLKVPAEVLTALDQHMVLVCQGLSEVTERNEEVLLHEIVRCPVTAVLTSCEMVKRLDRIVLKRKMTITRRTTSALLT